MCIIYLLFFNFVNVDQAKKDAIKAEILAELQEEKMREELKKELRAEMGIGQQNTAYSVTGEQKDRIVACVLAFFLFWVTAQRFYLNSKNKWLFAILSLVTGGLVGAVISLIDIIQYLQCKNNEEFTQKFANK